MVLKTAREPKLKYTCILFDEETEISWSDIESTLLCDISSKTGREDFVIQFGKTTKEIE